MTTPAEGQPLDLVLEEIRSDLSRLPHLEKLYQGIPDSVNDYPALVVYPDNGGYWLDSHSSEDGYSVMGGRHSIKIELLVKRVDMHSDYDRAMWFCHTLPLYLYRGFITDKFSGMIVTTGDSRLAKNAATINYRFLSTIYGAETLVGWALDFVVSTRSEVT